MHLSRLFNGRLSPINLSRFSSFATANVREAGLGQEDGSTLAGLQRGILRTQARHCCWVTAKNEVSSPSASGSSGLQKSCGTHAGSQSSSGTIAARAGKPTRAEMVSFTVDSEVARPWAQFSGSHETLSGSGSERAVKLSTAINSALLLPR